MRDFWSCMGRRRRTDLRAWLWAVVVGRGGGRTVKGRARIEGFSE